MKNIKTSHRSEHHQRRELRDKLLESRTQVLVHSVELSCQEQYVGREWELQPRDIEGPFPASRRGDPDSSNPGVLQGFYYAAAGRSKQHVANERVEVDSRLVTERGLLRGACAAVREQGQVLVQIPNSPPVAVALRFNPVREQAQPLRAPPVGVRRTAVPAGKLCPTRPNSYIV